MTLSNNFEPLSIASYGINCENVTQILNFVWVEDLLVFKNSFCGNNYFPDYTRPFAFK